MVDRLLNILKYTQAIDGWLIRDMTTETCELFFIGKKLDMNRRKHVRRLATTVYRNFEANSVKYTGSSSTNLSPAMTDDELAQKIRDTAQSAALVKNLAYELAPSSDEKLKPIRCTFDTDDLFAYMPRFSDAVFAEDRFSEGGINSCEFFLEKVDMRILNSCGIDESYTTYKGQVELVAEWKEGIEDVELFDIINFSDFNPEKLKKAVVELLAYTKQRATAVPLPAVKDVPVILHRESVGKFFSYYAEQTSVSLVYQKYSSAKIGENIQGESIIGDAVTMNLLPELEDSTENRYIDADGIKLQNTQVIRDGIVQTFHGSNQYAQYLGIAPTGIIGNMRVEGGSTPLSVLKQGPHLDVLYFSNFHMDPITGDFGGELRLGVYFDGKKEIPVTGGSVNGNIRDVQSSMQFSQEMQMKNNFCCPAGVKLFGVRISS